VLKEFKDFAMRGNVMDLAVGVIIGGAFGKIVTSLVNDVIMPVVGLFVGGIDFSGLHFAVGQAAINYGAFIQNIVDFLIIAIVIFLVVRSINRIRKPAPAAGPDSKDCPFCFTAIPIKATRCPNCTSDLAAGLK
jgi:large conductance mechanosensitive channel